MILVIRVTVEPGVVSTELRQAVRGIVRLNLRGHTYEGMRSGINMMIRDLRLKGEIFIGSYKRSRPAV